MAADKSSFSCFQLMRWARCRLVLGLSPARELRCCLVPWILPPPPLLLRSASRFLFSFVGCQKEIRQGD